MADATPKMKKIIGKWHWNEEVVFDMVFQFYRLNVTQVIDLQQKLTSVERLPTRNKLVLLHPEI